jgi:hypothetical protein
VWHFGDSVALKVSLKWSVTEWNKKWRSKWPRTNFSVCGGSYDFSNFTTEKYLIGSVTPCCFEVTLKDFSIQCSPVTQRTLFLWGFRLHSLILLVRLTCRWRRECSMCGIILNLTNRRALKVTCPCAVFSTRNLIWTGRDRTRICALRGRQLTASTRTRPYAFGVHQNFTKKIGASTFQNQLANIVHGNTLFGKTNNYILRSLVHCNTCSKALREP